jgi:hypothetical protein
MVPVLLMVGEVGWWENWWENWWRLGISAFVVQSALDDDDGFVLDLIDQTMLATDSAGPEPRELMFERLRLADAGEWIASDVFDEGIDFAGDFSISFNPVEIVFPALFVEKNLHGSIRVRSVAGIPARRSLMDLSNLAALAGDLSRYSVSSQHS